MSRAITRVFAPLAVGLVLALAGEARADSPPELDVDRAEADAREVMRELHGFCDSPRVPPRMDALRLCKLAKEVPDCEGFQKQCASYLEAKPPEPTPWLDALGRVIAAIAPYLGWTFVALAVGTILYLVIVGLYRHFTRDKKDDDLDGATDVVVTEAAPEVVIDPGSAEAILARAEAALARGDLHAALFGFLHAALRALDVRGAIRIERDRTNGEYVRSCSDEAARPNLRNIVYEVDVVQFGGREPSLDRVRETGRLATLLVRAATAALIVLLVGGCSGKTTALPRATDPAGMEVARALMKKQGFTVRSPEKALARLDEKHGGKPEPAMLLDVERTDLDTDAVAGLERWVKSGGVLILFGPAWQWPTEFRATVAPTESLDVSVQGALPPLDCTDISEECEEKAKRNLERGELPPRRARLAVAAAFKWVDQPGTPIALHDSDGATYASVGTFGAGTVIGVANDDLLTNLGLARPGNAAALVALLAHLPGREIAIIDEHGGITPSGDPLSSLMKAGLGLPIGHALLFALVLALAVGARIRAARPMPTKARRAFVEHVEATGALYAFTKAAPHALGAYGRFVTERLRGRISKGADLVTTLAQRADAPKDECQRVLDRATMIKAGDARQGDELAVLRDLADLYARAEGPMAPDSQTKPRGLRFRRRR